MIKIDHVKKEYGYDFVLKDISFVLNKGDKVGLIGRNGTGKSTILKMIIGEIEPDEGQIIIDKNEKIAYLPQCLDIYNNLSLKEFIAPFSESDNLVKRYIRKLDKDDIDFSAKIQTLSEGEKVKLAIIRLLLDNPTVMLLDEPSNNLDIAGLSFLSELLNHFKGAFILVSHDRWLLDKVTNQTLGLQTIQDGVVVKTYKGNYTFYKNSVKKEILQTENLYSNQQKIIRQAKKQKQSIRNRVATSNVNFRKGKQNRSLGIMDLSKDVKWSQKLSAINKKISTAELRKKELQISKDVPIKFDFIGTVPAARRVFTAQKIAFRIDKRYLFRDVNLDFYGQDKISIIGKNGCGKTTLLKIFLGLLKNYEGKLTINKGINIGYLPQVLPLDMDLNMKVADWFMAGMESNSPHLRKILGVFNIRGEAQSKELCELSEGMLRKIFLAKIVANNSNAIILDEPTNHMDIATIEEMERALLIFKGAILVVSHDRRFLRNIGVNRIYLLTSNGLRETQL